MVDDQRRARFRRVLGWTDLGSQAPDLQLLKKGNVHRPAGVVAAWGVNIHTTVDPRVCWPAGRCQETLRRTQLAKWIVDTRNPLTSRVMVNRLWQHLLGDGLVRSTDNFGFQGTRPLIQSCSTGWQQILWPVSGV